MDFEKINITELLPQKSPFVAVGKLLHFDMEKTVTSTYLNDNNLFMSHNRLSSSGIIENIAQTCATRIGYINKYILKKDIQIGFIGAIRNFKIYQHPSCGQIIQTEIKVIDEVFGMTLIKSTVRMGEALIAEGEMKIAVKEI